ncbi:mediator of RNA polymerase II transcription subunit 24-like isoform X2 [Drosophila miranda]|uniref:mediator of RNA polymerase II transcription subunit 24-like isoform X2 n=1 Tax=Drosophila miranda TaxID=7229 RepID=UPI00143F8084|nr:mediator of RNA polymerase II transcription subunit 24-like isoform X2 [Drosophila miranda]
MKENNKILQLIYVAWRERWSDSQWGINIKKLVLNYLKHSLCAHLVSHAVVLRCIARYDKLERIYCITSLLEFLVHTYIHMYVHISNRFNFRRGKWM